jgi:hypothetical protein
MGDTKEEVVIKPDSKLREPVLNVSMHLDWDIATALRGPDYRAGESAYDVRGAVKDYITEPIRWFVGGLGGLAPTHTREVFATLTDAAQAEIITWARNQPHYVRHAVSALQALHHKGCEGAITHCKWVAATFGPASL